MEQSSNSESVFDRLNRVGALSGPAMIAFVMPLPFAIGVPHHSTFNQVRNEELDWVGEATWQVTDDGPELPSFGTRTGVSIRVWRPRRGEVVADTLANEMMRVVASLSSDPHVQLPIQLSSDESAGAVLEASTPLFGAHSDSTAQEAVSCAFDRSVEEVGLFLRALRIVVEDPRIYPVGRLSLPPSVPFIVRYGESMATKAEGLLVVNWGESFPMFNPPSVSADEAIKLAIRVQRAKAGLPFFAAEDAHQRARRSYFVESDYAATVVFSITAIEVFCNELLTLLYWENGNDWSEVETILQSRGFETRMRESFHPLIGGNWNFKSRSSPIHAVLDVSTARHRFVHAGAEPTMVAADNALVAFHTVSEFAKAQLVANVYKFPRTSLLLLDESGLRRKHAWTRRFQLLVATLDAETNMAESFRDWNAN